MGEIVLARIDDRLIHGQVVTGWLNYTGANRIVIVDNETAEDSFMKSILSMALNADIKLDICNIEDGAKLLKNELRGEDKVIILVKTPTAIHGLLEEGVEIGELNIGGMTGSPDRKKLYKSIFISDKEREVIEKIMDMGVNAYTQIIPDERRTEYSALK